MMNDCLFFKKTNVTLMSKTCMIYMYNEGYKNLKKGMLGSIYYVPVLLNVVLVLEFNSYKV